MKIETQERLERPAYDEGLILESRGPGQREAIDTSAISLGYVPTLAARSGKEGASAAAERRLALRVYTHCHSFIEEACRMSSLPTSFLGALTASESAFLTFSSMKSSARRSATFCAVTARSE